jgi:hypothetical protein
VIRIVCAVRAKLLLFIDRLQRLKARAVVPDVENDQKDKLLIQVPPVLDQVPPVADDEWLLRLHFSPLHFNDGQLVASAISLSDLKDRGFSVDRESIVDIQTIQSRALTQSDRQPEQRETPYLSRFNCAPVRQLRLDDKDAFRVVEAPIDNNPAHAHILSAQTLGRGSLKQLRVLLLEQLQLDLLTLDQYINSTNLTINK